MTTCVIKVVSVRMAATGLISGRDMTYFVLKGVINKLQDVVIYKRVELVVLKEVIGRIYRRTGELLVPTNCPTKQITHSYTEVLVCVLT